MTQEQEEIIYFEPKERDWDYEYISDEEFLIEEILDDRINAHSDREFLIKWADCGSESNTWEPAAEFYIDGEATTIVLDYFASKQRVELAIKLEEGLTENSNREP
jgi:hypothetical protein